MGLRPERRASPEQHGLDDRVIQGEVVFVRERHRQDRPRAVEPQVKRVLGDVSADDEHAPLVERHLVAPELPPRRERGAVDAPDDDNF